MLFQQAERLVIGPLTTPIMDEFKINEAEMGLVFSGALIVGAILYPVWGYLYDRFARTKLLALAALIWGATTWLSGSEDFSSVHSNTLFNRRRRFQLSRPLQCYQ